MGKTVYPETGARVGRGRVRPLNGSQGRVHVNKPVIFSVDDDPNVLNAVNRDLRRKYGSQFRIMRADSGKAALEALKELKTRSDSVALFLVDQRMPEMNGVEFLTQARDLFPEAKRVLLTAYADTEAAIQAINTVRINHYLLKPWDPPEETLYPVLDDLLEDWQGNYRPPFEGVRIVGHRWSPEAHQLKDFLARNMVPYQNLDIEQNPEAQKLLIQIGKQEAHLPLVILPDGRVLETPSLSQVSEEIGLKRQAKQQFYDLAIVGGGPAGLAAAVYGASEGLHTVMIERQATGGQAGMSAAIENYLGFPSGLSGKELARRATAQAKRFGVEILTPVEARRVRVEGPYRILTLTDGSEISCHAMVISVGLDYRKLDIPGIDKLTGAGIYYGSSMTEAMLCKDGVVYVVGAGNSAGQAAIHLSEFASEVTILVRGDSLGAKMSQYLVERIEKSKNIHVALNTELTAVQGEGHLEEVTYKNCATGEEKTGEAISLFIFVGAVPCTDWLQGVVRMDERGFILTGPALYEDGKLPADWTEARPPFLLESSVPGLFVVGDVRASSIKRVASAVGEGSIAVQFIHQYLSKFK
jgi:thioredoxin reductase (NADPH)